MPAPERQEAIRGTCRRGEAGNPVVEGAFGLAMHAPGPLDPEDLGEPWPVQVSSQVGRGDQFPDLRAAPVPGVDGARDAQVIQRPPGQHRRRIKQERNGLMQSRLVLLDEQQIVAPGRPDLGTEGVLAKQGVAREHPSVPVQTIEQRGGDGQLGLGLVGAHRDRFVRQHDSLLMAEGAQGVHRTALSGKPQPAPLRLAVNGDALRSRLSGRRHGAGREAAGQSLRQGLAIQLAEQALER